jgi:DNA polymerase-3 subunit delta
MAARRALTPRAFIKAAAGKKSGGAFLVFGHDEYIKSETVHLAVEAHVPAETRGLAVTHLVGPQTDTQEILAAASALPMLGSCTAVVVHDAHRLASAHKSRITAGLDAVVHPSLLIFVGPADPDKRTKFYKWFTDNGRAIACEPLSGKQAEAFALRRFELAGKKVAAPALARFLSRCGTDAGIIAHEAEKLALFVGDRESIDLEAVEIVTGDSAGCTVEELVEAQLAGHTRRALSLSRALVSAGLDPTGIIGRLAMHYFDLQRAAASRQKAVWKLAGQLRLPGARAEELKRWLGSCRSERIGPALAHVAYADRLARSGRVEPAFVLDQLTLTLAGTHTGRPESHSG